MQKFFKDNIVLVLGISLPILLVIVFILAGAIPKFSVANPKYDFLFSGSKYYSPIEFVVIDQKVHFRAAPANIRTDWMIPHIYRYFAATGEVQEVSFTLPDTYMQKNSDISNSSNTNIVVSVDPHHLPSTEQAQDTSKIVSEINGANNIPTPLITPVTELSDIRVDNSFIAPDKYKFISANDRYNGRIFLLGLGSLVRNYNPIITKDGKNIPILYNDSGKGYYGYPSFIGWIIP